ncbi:MAG: cell wall hydrolase [Clostridia bacterium]|nr:cell wall hydrolase [Clostridia bacterium]MBQ6614351.1 cell wall hydrolase [Clostridia bacterium]
MNNCRKAVLAFASVLLMVLLMSFTCAASENNGTPITLYINNKQVDGARLIAGTAYAPYRTVVSEIEPTVEYTWNNEKRASVAHGNGIEIYAYSNEHYVEANGRVLYHTLAKNLNIDGTLYVPIRSIAAAYTLYYEWRGAEQAVYVVGTPKPLIRGEEFYDDDIVYWLSRIISAESRGEPFLGQIAVGNVILNRAEDGSFPNTVYGVIFDRKFGTQFTPAATGSVYNDPTASAVRAAKVVLEGVNVVDNALFFCAKRVSKGSWMDNNREYIDTIGNHVFYY